MFDHHNQRHMCILYNVNNAIINLSKYERPHSSLIVRHTEAIFIKVSQQCPIPVYSSQGVQSFIMDCMVIGVATNPCSIHLSCDTLCSILFCLSFLTDNCKSIDMDYVDTSAIALAA